MARKGERSRCSHRKTNRPAVNVKPGQELRVMAVVVQGPDAAEIKKAGARLCGGSEM
jgi:hypothetical protein